MRLAEVEDWLYATAVLAALVLTGFATTAFVHPEQPNPKLTPGASDPKVTQTTINQTVCLDGYTKTVRDVTEAEKKQVMARYGLPLTELHNVEIDHLISLENGGSNDLLNLWPQYYATAAQVKSRAYYGAREKDVVETSLHRSLCKGTITLREDQDMLRDWINAYKKLKGLK